MVAVKSTNNKNSHIEFLKFKTNPIEGGGIRVMSLREVRACLIFRYLKCFPQANRRNSESLMSFHDLSIPSCDDAV